MPKPNLAERAALVPTSSLAQFVIQQLLAGIKVEVTLDGKKREGVVHNLDFAPGSGTDHVFADVAVTMPDEEEKYDVYVRVSIHSDGTVHALGFVD